MRARRGLSALRRTFSPERQLVAADRELLERERTAHHLRVGRWLLPVLLGFHVLLAFVYRIDDPSLAEWWTGVRWIHRIMIPVAALGLVVAWTRQPVRLQRWLGDCMGVAYLLSGALLTANAQRVHSTLQVFLFILVAIPIFLRPRPLVFAGGLVVGLVVVLAAVAAWQTDPAARAANPPGAIAFSSVILLGAVMLHRARVLELQSRRALERLNAELERRVEEQVQEIVVRAREVEALNVQLAERVRERSHELSLVLARLAAGDTADALPSGSVLAGRVVVHEKIGAGGMGVVYRGVDRVTGVPVAVKVVQAASARELDGLQRFLREAQAVASVSHPAVVRTIHVDVTDDGRLFHVMELVEGMTLARRLAAHGALPPAVAARLGEVLADALAVAHASGVIHRDVKPANVMLTAAPPGLKLLDFGLSKLRDTRAATSSGTGAVILGTPEFMAPEQFADPASVTDRADVYSLGLVLYASLANRLPFDAESPLQWMAAHTSRSPVPVDACVPALPGSLAALVMSCLAKEPAERPGSGDVAVALRTIADEAGAPALERFEPRQESAAGDGALAPTLRGLADGTRPAS